MFELKKKLGIEWCEEFVKYVNEPEMEVLVSTLEEMEAKGLGNASSAQVVAAASERGFLDAIKLKESKNVWLGCA